MNDRYLFRAKHVHAFDVNKKYDGWVYGFLSCENYIYSPELGCEKLIDTSTICQCTGLKDKNGKLIWENDIVSFEDTGEEGYEYKEGFDFVNRAKVEFAECRWSLTDFASDNSAVMEEMYNHAEFMELWQYCEVIGSAIDNPELLEVGE